MRPYGGRRVLLGVTGGIASYKSAWLARLLHKAGAEVNVVLSQSAREFIGAITFEALTGRPVHTDLIAAGHALDHIKLAGSADLVVVAPATADFLARAAHGNASDLISAVLLATAAPVVLVPAMNDRMWAHTQTQANVARCRELGYDVREPDTGALAAGEGEGPGRMPEPEAVFAHIGRALERASLAGRNVVVTAGPTEEPVDPVRVLTNRSSGRMGVELAAAAWRRGATVTLIHGPLSVGLPTGVSARLTGTTAEMRDAVRASLPAADVLVMAAAPADFAPAAPTTEKIRKSDAPAAMALTPTADILLETKADRRPGCVVVGFALETGNALERGRAKLAAKALDAIVVNDAREAGAGFGVDTNRVTILTAGGREEELPLMPKREVAEEILDRIEGMLDGR